MNNNQINKIRPLTAVNNIDKVSPSNLTIIKERLYEENIKLKNISNALRQDYANAKSENHKLELEINKKDKMIEDIATDNRVDGLPHSPNENLKFSKVKEVKFEYS